MAGNRRTGRSCKFESLEKRYLLAGDVTASIHNGDLIIKGDDLANGITITAGATAGTVVITSVNAGGSATSVNGSSNSAVTLSGFTDDLKINMKGGNDTVTITNLDVPGNVKIKGGDGDDSITIDGGTIDGKLKIGLDEGDDTLSITDTEVTGKTEIKGKRGEDDVTIEDGTFTKLRVSLGKDNDSLDISGTTATVKTRFNGGGGTNTLTNATDNTLANFKEKNFGDADDDDTETPSVTAPTLAISGAASVNEGAPYTLNLSSTGDGGSTISKWTITWGDGSAAQVVNGDPSSVTHTYTDGGATPTISATATNPDGTFNAGNTVAVMVNNVAPTLSISGPASINEGALYTLNLSSSDPGADTISQWTINWGDGSAAQTVMGNPTSVTHTFTDGPATRTISATATDEDGTNEAGNTVTVTVNNVAPIASISGASSVNEGALYTLNLLSTDPGADTISQWTINWGDGSAAQTVTGNPTSVTHTFTDGPATRTISATATDEDGTVNATNTAVVSVNNVVPSLAISGAASVDEGAVYTLNLSSSDPGADSISQWTINWGDGTPSQTVNGNPASVTHTFADGAVTRTIIATATDEDSTFAATNTLAVIVNNVAPTLAISGAASVNEGTVYTLNLTSSDPGADTINQWSINWGDGSPLQTVIGNPASVTHTFVDGNVTATIIATASDEDSTFAAANSVAVNVINVPPTLAISGAASVNEGSPYTFNLSSSDPGPDTISQWTINWGDGTPDEIVIGNPVSVTHTFVDGPNNYTISATATDEDGTFPAGNTVSVTVNNVAPTVVLEGPTSILEGVFGQWTLSQLTDPGDDTAELYIIHWEDGDSFQVPVGQVIGGAIFHSYADGPNNYTISIDLVDEDGTHLAVATLDVTVNNATPLIALDTPSAILENQIATLTGSYTDFGLADSQTLVINWGDQNNANNSTFALPAIQVPGGVATLFVNDTFNSSTDTAVLTITGISGGQVSFSVEHQYLDDGEAPGNNLSADSISIFAFVTDSDGDGNLASAFLTIENAQPSVALNSVFDIVEGDVVTLDGTVYDAGILDTHTLAIDWSAPVAYTSTFELPAMQNAAGVSTLSVDDTFNSSTDSSVLRITVVEPTLGLFGFEIEHRYLDDGYSPGDYVSSNYTTVAVNVTDDDFGTYSGLTSFSVNDIAPFVTLNPVPDILENEFATLTGSYTDIGLLDGHSVSIAWDDPNAISNTSSFSVPSIQDSSGATTLHVGDTFNSSSDGAVLTITSIDASTGQVGFSVQHQYHNDGLVPGNDSFINEFTIGVTVTDDDFQTSSNFTHVTVHNVAPELTAPTPATQTTSEGGVASFTTTLSDPGILDALSVDVDWGDGTVDTIVLDDHGNSAATATPYVITSTVNGVIKFPYDADWFSFSALSGVEYTFQTSLSTLADSTLTLVDTDGTASLYYNDDWNGSLASFISWTAPSDGIYFIRVGGYSALSGTYSLSSTGTPGPGSGAITNTVGGTIYSWNADTKTLMLSHTYLDDPAGTTDNYTVTLTPHDDDGGTGTPQTVTVTVSNALPTVALNSVPDIEVGGTATLTGSYTDAGLLDAHTLSVDWGDSSSGSTFAILAIRNAAGTVTLNVNDTFSSTTDNAVFSVTSVDPVTGQVGFSIQHQYLVTGSITINANILDNDAGGGSSSTSLMVSPPIT